MKDNVAKWDLASRSVIPLIFKNKKFDNWKRITPFYKISLYRIIETTLYFTRFLSIDSVAQKEIFIYEFALKVNNKYWMNIDVQWERFCFCLLEKFQIRISETFYNLPRLLSKNFVCGYLASCIKGTQKLHL